MRLFLMSLGITHFFLFTLMVPSVFVYAVSFPVFRTRQCLSWPTFSVSAAAPSPYSPSQRQYLHSLPPFSNLPFSSASSPPFLPHHVNKTIPVIVTKSVRLVKSKWKDNALFFLDLAEAFGPDDILFFLTFHFILACSRLTTL